MLVRDPYESKEADTGDFVSIYIVQNFKGWKMLLLRVRAFATFLLFKL